jgi:hypothetical protein
MMRVAQIGVMEYWSSGVMHPDPTLHYSTTPILQG